MLIYLSKKIAVPNQKKVRSIAWSQEHGFIACGAENGLLKVLKLETSETKSSNLNLPKNLSMNQTLEGHNGDVISVVWNERYEKLTSSDSNGLIIVWMLYKGSWYEEMVNNRNRSVVVGKAWSADGLKICIVYEDGAIIVGSVDGNRLWGKEIKTIKLTCVQWSPDGRLILFGCNTGQVHIYDQSGNQIGKIPLPGVYGSFGRSIPGYTDSVQVVDMKWFSNGLLPNGLAIGLSNGIVQLSRNECDENAILIETKMMISGLAWNFYGTYLAVTGRTETSDETTTNWVKFFTPSGDLAQSMKVPGKDIVACAWEKEGLRIALGVDCYIFFANIRPDYKWAYFASTIVVSLPRDMKSPNDLATSSHDKVILYNHNSNSRQVKSIKNLIDLAAFGQYVVFATHLDDLLVPNPENGLVGGGGESGLGSYSNVGQSSLILCNSIGTPIDSVNIDLIITNVAINSNRAIATSNDTFVIWTFKVPSKGPTGHSYSTSAIRSSGASSFDGLISATGSESFDRSITPGKLETISVPLSGRDDRITCLTLSERTLVLGLDSGAFMAYLLPELSLSQKFHIDCSPKSIHLNCDSSKLAIIESSNLLTLCDLDSTTSSKAVLLDFEKRDVWDFCWSTENPDSFAITEKSKLIVYSNFEPEESVTSNGTICEFKDLVVRTVLLDSLIMEASTLSPSTASPSSSTKTATPSSPETSPNQGEYLIEHETKLLREAKEVLKKVGISEASTFIEENSHPKLWRLLADASFQALDFKNAELALVRCKDYKGIQFAKRVDKLPNEELKVAEVHAYFGKFDEAEKVFLDADRKDLAIQLRKTIGDWFQVVHLIRDDLTGRDDSEMREALRCLGDYYFESHKWSLALKYYQQCEAWYPLFQCYSLLENYDGLRSILSNIESGPLLQELGWTFESAGLCSEAVQAYQKAKRLDLALKCCVNLNEWRMAINLAQERQVTDIDALMSQYASHLLSKERYIDIVELYRKANRPHDACEMLMKIVDKVKLSRLSHPINMKKVYTLIGLLYEQYYSSSTASDRRNNTLASLLTDESSQILLDSSVNMKALDQPWKGSEAYHFYLSAHRQLYEGYYDSAMKTSLNLIDYDDFIEPEDIYCLIAIASIANSNYYIASKAFIKLESLESIPEERRSAYQDLAVTIFAKNPPKESKTLARSECTHCETMIADWSTVCPSCNVKFPICIASGKPIMDSKQQWTCSRCKHNCLKVELVSFSNCPLCHYPITS